MDYPVSREPGFRSGASPEKIKQYLDEHSRYHSQLPGKAGHPEVCCGQGAGLISNIPDAGDLVTEIANNIAAGFEQLGQKLKAFY